MSRPLLMTTAIGGFALAAWGCFAWPLDSLQGLVVEAAGVLLAVASVQRLTS